MDHSTAARAGIDPPSRRIIFQKTTATARTGGIIFWDLHHRHPVLPGFIGQILPKLAVRPLADLLVGHPPKSSLILNVAHVPNCDLSYVVRLAELDHLAAGFVQDVPLLAM